MCGRCHTCEDCCNCANLRNNIQYYRQEGPPTFHEASKSEFKKNDSKRHLSVEIEVAMAELPGNAIFEMVVDKWKGSIVEDGSLPRSGFEINTAPANGDKFVNQIKEICAALQSQKSSIDKSCGLHVHVNAKDFNYYDLRKLAYLYAKVEDALFSVVAPSRKQSRFCYPCGDKYVHDLDRHTVPKDNENKIQENVYGRKVNVSQIKRNKYEQARYNALNIHSWFYRGSIECRMHQGTVNATRIINWAMLWAAILDFAFYNTENDIKALKGDSFQILMSVAPTAEIKEWLIERRKKFESKSIDENTDL